VGASGDMPLAPTVASAQRLYPLTVLGERHVSCSPALAQREVSQLRYQEVAYGDVATCDVTPNALWCDSSQVSPRVKFLRT